MKKKGIDHGSPRRMIITEYQKWLKNHPDGIDEAQNILERLDALREKWDRKS